MEGLVEKWSDKRFDNTVKLGVRAQIAERGEAFAIEFVCAAVARRRETIPASVRNGSWPARVRHRRDG